jgi:hypothetical protein
MNDAAYIEWLDTLTPETRDLVQKIMARIGALLNTDRRGHIDDIQRIERRQATNSGRVAELQLRLDQYEDRQWSAAKEAIEQFAATQLTEDERTKLIEALYRTITDVSALKAEVERLKVRAAGDAR